MRSDAGIMYNPIAGLMHIYPFRGMATLRSVVVLCGAEVLSPWRAEAKGGEATSIALENRQRSSPMARRP